MGYGQPGSGLVLNLVTNPVGAFLPPEQRAAEAEWKARLREEHGIVFTQLFTITNMPISRFLSTPRRGPDGRAYLTGWCAPTTRRRRRQRDVRDTLSVAWDGTLRLRLQPDARPAGGPDPATDHPRLRGRRARRPAHRGGTALLRLHGGRRLGAAEGALASQRAREVAAGGHHPGGCCCSPGARSRPLLPSLPARVAALGLWGPVAVAGLYALLAVALVPGLLLTLAAGVLFGVGVGSVVRGRGRHHGAAL
ncbi:MAG: DUF3641 domain-containing protein, partial [Gemmatimonadetes bacterium]|nr:DUF3641 domain-containing protein [Gemmatimonadota bacterium]